MNSKGRDIIQRIEGTKFRVLAPTGPTFHARGRRASSAPDIAIQNIQGRSMTTKQGEMWSESSDHTPIQLISRRQVIVPGEMERKRTSKTSLHNELKRKHAGKVYRDKLPDVIAKLNAATHESAQKIYNEATAMIVVALQIFARRWPRGRPKQCTKDLERRARERRRVYREEKRTRDIVAWREN